MRQSISFLLARPIAFVPWKHVQVHVGNCLIVHNHNECTYRDKDMAAFGISDLGTQLQPNTSLIILVETISIQISTIKINWHMYSKDWETTYIIYIVLSLQIKQRSIPDNAMNTVYTMLLNNHSMRRLFGNNWNTGRKHTVKKDLFLVFM